MPKIQRGEESGRKEYLSCKVLDGGGGCVCARGRTQAGPRSYPVGISSYTGLKFPLALNVPGFGVLSPSAQGPDFLKCEGEFPRAK